MIIARRFSLTNFVIATTALGFQVFVLYPWHKQLDDDFVELKRESLKALQERKVSDAERMKELIGIRGLLEEERNRRANGWFW
jgi:hypothetical protein